VLDRHLFRSAGLDVTLPAAVAHIHTRWCMKREENISTPSINDTLIEVQRARSG
jgi:hypothetical protein